MKYQLSLIVAVVVGAAVWQSAVVGPNTCDAAHTYAEAGDLFYNFYVPPAGYDCRAASMYPCPMPVPPWVGHTYITYQPLMPHEFLYKHRRSYQRIHPDGRVTRTRVSWR
jgi:hypothetical protein